MSKRTDRRESDRLARRNAYLQSLQPEAAAEQATTHITEPTEPLIEFAVSEARRIANIANAQLSTGPTTEAGKAISSQNALKYALTGKTVLLPTDDAAEYQKLLDAHTRRHAPASDEEQSLVQSLLDCTWRIQRIKTLESGILLKGQIEFAKLYEDQPAARRAVLIQVETYLKYEKSIRNLNIQEARLHRRMEKDEAELTRLQTLRKREERTKTDRRPVPAPATPSHAADRNGFVFSTTENNPLSAPEIAAEATQISQSAGLR